MSTLSVDTIEDRSASESVDATYVVHGTMKSYVNYDSVAPLVGDSLNVSSVDDDGTGNLGVNYTNSFDSVNYSTVGMGSWTTYIVGTMLVTVNNKAVGATEIDTLNSQSGTATDSIDVNVAALGDLA